MHYFSEAFSFEKLTFIKKVFEVLQFFITFVDQKLFCSIFSLAFLFQNLNFIVFNLVVLQSCVIYLMIIINFYLQFLFEKFIFITENLVVSQFYPSFIDQYFYKKINVIFSGIFVYKIDFHFLKPCSFVVFFLSIIIFHYFFSGFFISKFDFHYEKPCSFVAFVIFIIPINFYLNFSFAKVKLTKEYPVVLQFYTSFINN